MSLQRTDEADVAFGLEVEIEIEEEFDVLAGAIAEACKLIVERLLDADRRVELGSAGRATEAGHVEFRTPTVEQKDVGLERREAALAHVLAELADVVERADRREAHFLGVVQAVGAAVRPVQAEPIADGPAEHFAYGHRSRPAPTMPGAPQRPSHCGLEFDHQFEFGWLFDGKVRYSCSTHQHN